jgi:hypothetical protein
VQLWRKREGQADLLSAAGELPLSALLDLAASAAAGPGSSSSSTQPASVSRSVALPLAVQLTGAISGSAATARAHQPAAETSATCHLSNQDAPAPGAGKKSNSSACGSLGSSTAGSDAAVAAPEAEDSSIADAAGPLLHIGLAYAAKPCAVAKACSTPCALVHGHRPPKPSQLPPDRLMRRAEAPAAPVQGPEWDVDGRQSSSKPFIDLGEASLIPEQCTLFTQMSGNHLQH